jgi:hypothetical protein
MKTLSLRGYDQLRALQSLLREVTYDRNTALRIFIASRHSTTPQARREFWLEFSWLDQEYRVAVRRLAQFCADHGDSATSVR